jgi:MerR family transcriptional regulator/heat shock protein HspR
MDPYGEIREDPCQSVANLSPVIFQCALRLSRFGLIAEGLHLIMHALHTRRLTSHDFAHGRRQGTRKRFLVSVFRNILSVFQPIEHSMIIATQRDFCIHPGPVQRTLRRSGYFFLRLAKSRELRLQFFGEFSALCADLDEKRFQICAFNLLRGLLKAVLPVPAPFNQMFHYIDRIVLVHFDLRQFDARRGLRFGVILPGIAVELEGKGTPALKSSGYSMTKRKSKGAYMISSVAEMYGIHPQTLRLYEREGLLKPSRTEGNTRLYTDEDLQRLEFILSLARDLGVNIAGMAIILQMRERMEEMQRQIQEFVQYIQQEVLTRASAAADPSKGAIVPVRRQIVPAEQGTKRR